MVLQAGFSLNQNINQAELNFIEPQTVAVTAHTIRPPLSRIYNVPLSMQMEISSFFLNMQHVFAYKPSSNFSLQQGLALFFSLRKS